MRESVGSGFINERRLTGFVYPLVRGLLFRLDPERAHGLAMNRLARWQRSPRRLERMERRNRPDLRLIVHCLDSVVPGPLGLAAGFDKGAEAPDALLGLGFSHVEVGTVTPKPQEGNPKPRMERHPEAGALVNRLGFNNPGMMEVAKRLATRVDRKGLLGVNVGANKERFAGDHVKAAMDDYVEAAKLLAPYAGYVTINVSSPNTPGLRSLQAPDGIKKLVQKVIEGLEEVDAVRPVLVKLHPDGHLDELVPVARAAVDAGAGGIVAVNTTTTRPGALKKAGEGGLSGRPLKDKAHLVMVALSKAVGDRVPLVGVGGIETGYDAAERMAAGATLLQAYTGFVFRGPAFPVRVHRELIEELDKRGLDRAEELVGSGLS